MYFKTGLLEKATSEIGSLPPIKSLCSKKLIYFDPPSIARSSVKDKQKNKTICFGQKEN